MSETDAGLPESGMNTGSDAGTPGEDRADDLLSAAVEDDSPLPDGDPQVGSTPDDPPADDGLSPAFSSA